MLHHVSAYSIRSANYFLLYQSIWMPCMVLLVTSIAQQGSSSEPLPSALWPLWSLHTREAGEKGLKQLETYESEGTEANFTVPVPGQSLNKTKYTKWRPNAKWIHHAAQSVATKKHTGQLRLRSEDFQRSQAHMSIYQYWAIHWSIEIHTSLGIHERSFVSHCWHEEVGILRFYSNPKSDFFWAVTSLSEYTTCYEPQRNETGDRANDDPWIFQGA